VNTLYFAAVDLMLRGVKVSYDCVARSAQYMSLNAARWRERDMVLVFCRSEGAQTAFL
jgi:hypothetical protein